MLPPKGALAFDRFAQRINHAPKAADGRTAPSTDVTSARQPRRTPSKEANGIRGVWSGKSDDLARNGFAGSFDDYPGPDRHGVQRSCDLNHQAAHADDPSIDLTPSSSLICSASVFMPQSGFESGWQRLTRRP